MKLKLKLSAREWKLILQGGQALLAGILAGVLIYAGVQMSSAYMKGYEFEKATRKEAQLAAANFTATDTVRDEILQKAQDLGLAVEPDEIKVTAAKKEAQIPIAGVAAIVENGSQNDLPTVAAVNIDVSYEVPIAFPLYTFEMQFRVHADDHTI